MLALEAGGGCSIHPWATKIKASSYNGIMLVSDASDPGSIPGEAGTFFIKNNKEDRISIFETSDSSSDKNTSVNFPPTY